MPANTAPGRADGARLVDSQPVTVGGKEFQIKVYDNDVVAFTVKGAAPMSLEQFQNRGTGKPVIVVLKPDTAY
jgi:hypothetical protein